MQINDNQYNIYPFSNRRSVIALIVSLQIFFLLVIYFLSDGELFKLIMVASAAVLICGIIIPLTRILSNKVVFVGSKNFALKSYGKTFIFQYEKLNIDISKQLEFIVISDCNNRVTIPMVMKGCLFDILSKVSPKTCKLKISGKKSKDSKNVDISVGLGLLKSSNNLYQLIAKHLLMNVEYEDGIKPESIQELDDNTDHWLNKIKDEYSEEIGIFKVMEHKHFLLKTCIYVIIICLSLLAINELPIPLFVNRLVLLLLLTISLKNLFYDYKFLLLLKKIKS